MMGFVVPADMDIFFNNPLCQTIEIVTDLKIPNRFGNISGGDSTEKKNRTPHNLPLRPPR